MRRATLIDWNPDEHNQVLPRYPFIISLDRYDGSCNTIGQKSGRIRIPNKTGEIKLKVFNMIKQTSKLKTLCKDISCNCGCKFDAGKYDSVEKWNKVKCQCECRKPMKQSVCKDNCALN